MKKISLKGKLEKLFLTAVLEVSNVFMLQIAEGNASRDMVQLTGVHDRQGWDGS